MKFPKPLAAAVFWLAAAMPVPALSAGDAAASTPSAAAHSLKQTLGTDAYAGILKSLANPATLNNPVSICAHCHAGEDMARYAATIGPMLQMVNPVNWLNPMAYWNMAAPMMDPATYKQWYDAYVEKYGSLLGYDPTGSSPSQ